MTLDEILTNLQNKPDSKWTQTDRAQLYDNIPELNFVWGHDFEYDIKELVDWLIELRKMWGLRENDYDVLGLEKAQVVGERDL